MSRKQPKVFISHSSEDYEYVQKIVDLLSDMGLNSSQVFCSSQPGYGIPIGSDIFEYLRDQFSVYDLHVIFVHSDNYYKSSVSLNEMGAAWVLRSDSTSILLPGFGFDKMTGVMNNRVIAIKLDGQQFELQDKLNQLYDKITEEFNIPKETDIIWQQKRDSFISEIQRLINEKQSMSSPSIDKEKDLRATIIDSVGIDVTREFDKCNILLYSLAAQKYATSDEKSDGPQVYCNTDRHEKWEILVVEVDRKGRASFKAPNGKYLCTDRDSDFDCPPIKAIGTRSLDYEKFKIYKYNGYYALKASCNEKWVTCNMKLDNNPLYATADVIDLYEKFVIEDI